ncbi:MAG: MBG domain-containing protein [Bacteroidota bacterium]
MLSIKTFNRCFLYLFIFSLAFLKLTAASGQSNPEFLSSPEEETTYGNLYQYNISIYDEDGDELQVIVQSGDLPSGISLSKDKGEFLLVGYPNETGYFPITLEVYKKKDPSYNDQQSFTIEVSKSDLYVTAIDQNITYGEAIPTLNISYSGFVNGDDETNLTTAPSATTNADINSDVGDYPINVSGGVSENYNFDYTEGSLSIIKAGQTITFDEIADKNYGDADFTLSASSDSGLPISFSVISGSASLSGNILSIDDVGTVTVEAQQDGENNYEPATPISRSFAVTKTMLSVSAEDKNINYGDAIPELTIIYSGFINEEDEDDLISAPIASTTADANSETGDYSIEVSGGESDNYDFTYTSGNLSITKAEQIITFEEIADKNYGDEDFTLSASSDSGLPISFSIISGSASVSGNILSINGTGTITLEAQQAGDINYEAATPVSRSLEVIKTLLSVTADDKNINYGDAIPELTITYSGFVNGETEADLTTTPTASTTADSNSDEGDYTINVSGGISANYEFTYTAGNLNIANGNQTITFDEISDKTYGDEDFTLSATSDSGLPVSFSIISGPAALSGNILSINGAGTVTVEAQQAGDNNYEPATPVSRSFEVFKDEAVIQISNTLQNFDGSPKEVIINTQPEGLNYSITYNGSSTAPSSAGTYTIVINIEEDNYTGQLTSELVINSAPTTSGIPNQQVPENSSPLQLDLLNFFEDMEDDDVQLAFNVISNSNPALFSDIVLTDNILSLSFEANSNGISSLTIRCTDSNGLFIEDEFEIEVLPPDQTAPFFTSTPILEVLQDEEYQYVITAEDNDTEDELSISNIISLPSWLSLTDNGDGTALLSGVPTNNNVDVYGLAIRVSDDQGNSTNQFFDIEVIDVNDPPVFTSSPVIEAEVNQEYSYSITTEDIDQGDEVSIFAIEKPNWLTFSTESLPKGRARLQGIPTTGDRNSTKNVILLAVDLREDSTFQNYTIEIEFPNTAPFFTSAPVTEATQDELYEYQITANDSEGDDVNINTPDLPTWLSFDEENWVLSGIPENENVGGNNITLEVLDFLGLKSTQNFTIEVENVNDPPTIISTPITSAEENQLYEYRIVAEDIDLYDNVEITVTQKPEWLNFNGENLLRGTPDFADIENSPSTVEIIASDNAGATDIQSFQISVHLENMPPTINRIANPVPINEDSEENFTINLTGITDGGENSQELSLSVSTNLSDLFEELYIDYQSPNSSAILNYKILPDSFGIATVTIKVEDDGPGTNNFVEASFQIEIMPVNDVPVFISNPEVRFQKNVLYQYFIEATDADPDDELVIRKTFGPQWLNLNDNQNGSATLEGIAPSDAENEEISISVTDLQNASSTQSFILQINSVPVISDFSVKTNENNPYLFKISDFAEHYTDAEDDAINELKLYFSRGKLQLNGTEINTGAAIEFNENLNLQFIPPQDFHGNLNLNWSASDGFEYSKTAQILMEIDTVNDKPTLTNIENSTLEFTQGSEAIQITETITVSDFDNLTMDTVWVQISDNYNPAEDRLFLEDVNIINIDYEFNQSSGALLITGNASKSDYDLILRSISYQNINSLSEDINPKNIQFIISDGENQSESISREVQLVNLLPELGLINAFTPDGNNVNDNWDFINLEAFEQVNISVYNAQGLIVYHCKTNDCAWDGNFNNKKLPSGTYFYLIKLNNGRRKYEGNVTILR